VNERRVKVVAEVSPQELFSSGEAARWTKYGVQTADGQHEVSKERQEYQQREPAYLEEQERRLK
jgi:hypothetical protein